MTGALILGTFGALIAAAAIGTIRGWWEWPDWKADRQRRPIEVVHVYPTEAEQQAIIDALTNLAPVDHLEDDPQTEYALAALRRDLDEWGKQ